MRLDPAWIRAIGLAILLLSMLPAAVKRIREAGLVQAMLLRVAAGAGLLAATFWVAFGIDAGRYAGQPHSERVVLVTMMMLAMATGVLLIVSVLWAAEGVFGVPYRFIAWTAFGVVTIVVLLLVGEQLEQRFGIYHERLFYGAAAAGLAVATLVRPWWFWGHAKARFVRNIIGDHSTIILYLLIAGGLGWYAILERWGPAHAMHRRGGGRFSGRIVTCYQLRGADLEAADLGDQVAYAPGFETGFAIWMPRAEFGDTTRRIAYDGRWHRTPGDTTLIRIEQDGNGSIAEIVIAPGPFPRGGEIQLPAGAKWGKVTEGRVISVEVDSTSCAVELARF